MMSNAVVVWFSSTALVLGASACIAATDMEPEQEVGVVEQALGGVAEVVRFGGVVVMDVGPTYTVIRRGTASCSSVEVFITTTGEQVPAPALP